MGDDDWRNGVDPNELEEARRRARQQKQKAKPNGLDLEPLELLDFTILQDKPVPELRWLVRDWVPWRRVTGLCGVAGGGKTLLCQQLMTATAIRRQWLGRGSFPVRSLGVFCEDDDEDLHRRQAAINGFYGCEFRGLETMIAIPRLGFDNLLMTFETGRPLLTNFYHQILSAAQDFGAQLVIVDTVADTFGGNHNDPGQARQFVQIALGGLARALDGIVIATAHPSRSGQSTGSGEFGSVQWDATFRSRMYLEGVKEDADTEGDPNLRTLTRKKANYALRSDTIPLRWKDGVLVNTDTGGVLGSIERRTCERVFFDLLDRITEEGRHVSDSVNAGTYAPRIFSRRPDREGFRQADFAHAMERLFADKKIKNGSYRKSGHDHDCIIKTGL
jgi:RecA-family ATPase